YVLPGPRGGYLKKTCPSNGKAITERAGITDLGIRDLRRTQGSWQTMMGANIQVVGETLGHTRPESTNIYARLSKSRIRGGNKCRLASDDGSRKKIDE
ncbi:MAG: tyrosine-type recombinase/integrase, partial [bacterium]